MDRALPANGSAMIESNSPSAPFRSGYVAIIGKPNVGKSTLLNAVLGQKIAITTRRPQTTRNRILGIHTMASAQLVFMDTPGIHAPKDKLGEYMVDTAVRVLEDVDVALLVVEPTLRREAEEPIIDHLRRAKTPCILVINKIDRVSRDSLLPVVDAYQKMKIFKEILPVSALKKTRLDALVDLLIRSVPEGPPYYPEDIVSDQVERFMAAELIRETVMEQTRDELPYSVAVNIEEFSERETGAVYIRAILYVERESQKGIIIGHGGQTMKRIGMTARRKIEGLLAAKVYLDLRVKRRDAWRQDAESLRDLGYI